LDRGNSGFYTKYNHDEERLIWFKEYNKKIKLYASILLIEGGRKIAEVELEFSISIFSR